MICQATRIITPHIWWWWQRAMSVGCQGSGVFCQPRAHLVWMETCGIRITAFRDCGRRVEWKCVNHQVSVHAHGNERCLCTAQDTERNTSCLFPRFHLSDGSQQQTNNLPRCISLFCFSFQRRKSLICPTSYCKCLIWEGQFARTMAITVSTLTNDNVYYYCLPL